MLRLLMKTGWSCWIRGGEIVSVMKIENRRDWKSIDA